MSAAGRKRIAEAARKMWALRKKKRAERKASAKKTAPKLAALKPAKRRISAAARKKLSEMMKQRWASGKMGKAKTTA